MIFNGAWTVFCRLKAPKIDRDDDFPMYKRPLYMFIPLSRLKRDILTLGNWILKSGVVVVVVQENPVRFLGVVAG
jgi:hypothetical protein